MVKLLLAVAILISLKSVAQFPPKGIHSDFVLYQKRIAFDKYMREQTIKAAFAQPLDSNTEEKYREACWAISQFLLRSTEIQKGFRVLFNSYATLEEDTRRSLIEAIYAVYPVEYKTEINELIRNESVPKLFAMQAAYLYRMDQSTTNTGNLHALMLKQFPGYTEYPVLTELEKYLQTHRSLVTQSTPAIVSLFNYRKQSGQKTIYSFQRWNRDYPGLAIIQNEDGSFAKDSMGKLLVFQQLARSASDLPYFLTNGSTPQGIYSIQGTAISRQNLIGPTPNIQLVMPGEADSVFWHSPYDSARTPLENYFNLLPASWRGYAPITESFYAGKIGRTEIIAHGTTIDPDYYKDKPFYPLTPTMGCLCARESWNIFNGTLLQSEQFNFSKAFLATPGVAGYLIVINLDNQQKMVERGEIEKLVAAFL
ncbi:MAG: hypothetical protein V4557_15720 [Bacteroidota bacterium]